MIDVRPQVCFFYISLTTLILSVAAAVRANLNWALALFLLAMSAWAAARVWNRRRPIPMPYSMRWILLLPRGPNSPGHLRKILRPEPGERILEVGSGIGIHALAIAAALVPKGVISVLDVQHEMLDNLKRRANRAGISNIVATQGDAQALPYRTNVFDSAYMVGTLGEIPDEAAALRELRRVLKPEGRLVIGEVVIDPDYVNISALREKATHAGLAFERSTGPMSSYFALFRPAVEVS